MRTEYAVMFVLCIVTAIGCGKSDDPGKLGEPVAFCHLYSIHHDNAAILESACYPTLAECAEGQRVWDESTITRDCQGHRGSLWCFEDRLVGTCSPSEDECISDRRLAMVFLGGVSEQADKLVGVCKENASFPVFKQ